MEEVQKLQSSATKQNQEFSARVTQLEEELARKDEQITQLNDSLNKQADYQELKKELQYVCHCVLLV